MRNNVQVSVRKVFLSFLLRLLSSTVKIKKPKWLKVKLPTGQAYKNVRGITKSHDLHTICESGNCLIWASVGEKGLQLL